MQLIRSFEDSEDSDKYSKAVGVHYTSGSLTSFEAVYPSFRLFELDEETLLPVKIHTYMMNLTDENPEWYLDHTLPEYYGLEDLSPSSFEGMANKIIKGDQDLAIKF